VTTAPAAVAAVQPSLAEQLIAFGRGAWDQLQRLDAREAGINILLSAAVALIAVGLIWLLRRLFDRWLARFLARAPGETEDDHKRTPKAAGVTWALVRLAVLAAAVLLVMGVWGIDPWTWLSGDVGARLVRLVLIAVLVTALVEVTGFVIGRLIEGFARRSGDHRRAAQLRTLSPLLTGSAQGILIVVGLLTFLSELGLKVGPILASAGVVGIAVGFGAQTLVKDFLTGLFLIAEDVVSVGDNVRIGDSSGTVETMTMRTIRLRDTNGTLHIFPYSEAQVIHNRTKVFSSYVVEIPVSYDSDVDRALAILQALGDEMAADPALGRMITRPFEVLGVDRLTENAVHLKARFTTEPRAQWKIGREFNRRLKNAFDTDGIVTPVKTVTLQRPPHDGLDEKRSFDASQASPES
jgi:small conductance mechanosensitive channel